MSVSNSGTIQSQTEQIQISNHGGSLGLSNLGSITAAEQIQVANDGDCDSGSCATTIVNSGSIAGSTLAIQSGAGNLQITGTGSLSAGPGQIQLNSQSGSISAIQGGVSGTVTGDAGTSFLLATTKTGLNFGDISAGNGSVTVVAGTGTLSVSNGATIAANEGNITLQDLNGSSGNIAIGQGARIAANTHSSSTGLGNVYVSTGAMPASAGWVQGTAPAGVSVHSERGGQVYFGSLGITTSGKGITLNAKGSDIVFNALPGTSISLQSGVNITADPPAPAGPGGASPAAVILLPSVQAGAGRGARPL